MTSSVQLRTPHDFAGAVARFRSEPRCSLALSRTRIREHHLSASVVLARVPKAITRVSPEVHAFRKIWTEHGKRWILDTIFIFDRASREIPLMSYEVLAGKVPLSVEVRATEAALRSLD